MIAYSTAEPDRPLRLLTGDFELCGKATPVTLSGAIALDWYSRPKLALTFERLEMDYGLFSLLDERLQARDPTGLLGFDLSGELMLTGRAEGFGLKVGADRVKHQDPRDPDQVVFHVANLDTLHERSSEGHGYHSLSNISLQGGGWLIDLSALPSEERRFGVPSFAITHAGVLRRANAQSFSKESATDILEGLRFFLSFARGRWTWPCMYIGAALGECCWYFAEGPKDLDPLLREHHQLPFSSDKSTIKKSFAGFAEIWNKKLWRDPIRAALSWYIENERALSAESALLSSITALELISWLVVVEEKAIISADGCNHLPVADQIRLLLTLLGIPARFPANASELETYSRGKNRRWDDGPRAVTELRNSIVHPRRRDTFYQAPQAVQQKARRLASRYLASAILRIFGYGDEIPEAF